MMFVWEKKERETTKFMVTRGQNRNERVKTERHGSDGQRGVENKNKTLRVLFIDISLARATSSVLYGSSITALREAVNTNTVTLSQAGYLSSATLDRASSSAIKTRVSVSDKGCKPANTDYVCCAILLMGKGQLSVDMLNKLRDFSRKVTLFLSQFREARIDDSSWPMKILEQVPPGRQKLEPPNYSSKDGVKEDIQQMELKEEDCLVRMYWKLEAEKQ
ncbi:hypothetical protein ANN_20048 [Periplaneta americana]|uniref:Uncharacterized protein n=1 Tax=Periplaneta americana TaxID=6978 RepID=A0ABQ8SC76_PERAM|nr:hypothetical protein ANN_20048 [Periplaneta americana]